MFGLDNKQRIAFENLLISILPNTSKVVPLSDWKTPSGRVKSWGYDVLVFNDITLKSLTTDFVTLLKSYINGNSVDVNMRRKESFPNIPLVNIHPYGVFVSQVLKGSIFFVAKEKWLQKKERDFLLEELILYVPFTSRTNFSKYLDLSKNASNDVGGIINWAMAFSNNLLNDITSNFLVLSNYLERGSKYSSYLLDQWFFSNVRIRPKGYDKVSKEESNQFKNVNWYPRRL